MFRLAGRRAAAFTVLRSARVAPFPVTRVFSSLEVPEPPTSHHAHPNFPDAKGRIIYTETDEAPALATFSLYPVIGKVSYERATWRGNPSDP